MAASEIAGLLFAGTALAGVIGGAINRCFFGYGIGAQFIRYISVVVALPAGISLAIFGMLTEAAVSIITGVLAYAFAGVENDERYGGKETQKKKSLG
mgnify:CR=1 FL=1